LKLLLNDSFTAMGVTCNDSSFSFCHAYN